VENNAYDWLRQQHLQHDLQLFCCH